MVSLYSGINVCQLAYPSKPLPKAETLQALGMRTWATYIRQVRLYRSLYLIRRSLMSFVYVQVPVWWVSWTFLALFGFIRSCWYTIFVVAMYGGWRSCQSWSLRLQRKNRCCHSRNRSFLLLFTWRTNWHGVVYQSLLTVKTALQDVSLYRAQ